MRKILAVFVLVFWPAVLRAESPARPNVILMMADDQGWGDTSYNGHPELKTPQLDKLAAAGLRLDHFYTGHFNCSPTRASVMTGRHPARMGTFSPGAPIRPQELTVAAVLQSSGYATGHFGKWHLNGKNGDRNTKAIPGRAIMADDPLSPGKMGFDEWVSADNFFDLDPVLGRNGVPEKFHGDSSDVTTDEAFEVHSQTGDRGQAVLECDLVRFAARAARGACRRQGSLRRAAGERSKLLRRDHRYRPQRGRVRDALRELKIAENTIIWYCSDNGGAAGPKSTGNLRGSKGTFYEGGLRVPGIVEWPARIKKPAISDVPCSTLDIYPTILAATGSVAKQQIEPLDGINLLPLFDGQMTERSKAIPFWRMARIKAATPRCSRGPTNFI